ncbi:MAG: 16S rRNA (guanine(966)-N(2))-methyltransferase RsmD [Muribaculaceae bacterium]|nr:16S rRNA (guanine(966)-N(2))-methyltransferase RsmD [Muribaculaceae bacterium]
MRIIRGKYGRRRFDVPRNITARPTTDFARENIFNVIENLRDIEGTRVLDLFAGTGAVSLEFLSRGASEVTAVEMAQVQARFIISVGETLGDDNLHVIKGDVFRFLANARRPYDIVFADPPYDHPRFAEIPELIMDSGVVAPGTLVIIEHGKSHSFSRLPGFDQHRAYGSVNFSIFEIPEPTDNSYKK